MISRGEGSRKTGSRSPTRRAGGEPSPPARGGDLDRGDLVAVLEEFSTPFPGFFLYYPGRRQASPPLRALVDYILSWRRSTSAR